MPRHLPSTPTVAIRQRILDAAAAILLAEVSVERSVTTGARSVLRFHDPNYEQFDRPLASVGDELEVSVSGQQGSITLFSGTVTGVAIDHASDDEAVPVLVIEGRDDAHLLARSTTFKAYLKQSVSDVVTEVAGRYSLKTDIETTGTTEPYLLQSGTDHAFLSHLAADLGFEWYVADGTLHFHPRRDDVSDGAMPTVSIGDQLVRFSASYSAIDAPQAVEVHGWNPAQQTEVVADASSITRSSDRTIIGSDARFAAEERAKTRTHVSGVGPYLVAATAVRNDDEAETLAEAIGRRLVGSALTFEGIAREAPQIDAGAFVNVEGVGRRLSGCYYVTEVEHRFDQGGLITRFRTGDGADEMGEATHREHSATGAGAGHGLVLGLVTNVSDPEGWGRVKVRYPTLGEPVDSDWARLVLPGAGPGRGFDFRPEVGDEVLVGFDRGDARFPFVLGGVWSGEKSPPEDVVPDEDDGVVTKRVLRSRTGQTITISDGPSNARDGDPDRHVEIALADGVTKVLVAEDGIVIETKDGNPLSLKTGSNSLTFTESGDLVIKANSFDLDVKKAATLKGESVKIDAKQSVAIEGKSSLAAKGAQVTVEGQGKTTIKGAMVEIN